MSTTGDDAPPTSERRGSPLGPGAAPDRAGGPRARWRRPVPLMTGAAVDSMTGVAAPLLAGFSLTLLGVVAQDPTSFRWPSASLALLTVVAALLVGCVQTGFRARSFLYSPAEARAWYPDTPEDVLERQQSLHYEDWDRWHGRANVLYNASLLLLAVAIATVLLPPRSYGGAALDTLEIVGRTIASVLALAAGVAEAIWMVHDRTRR